MWSSAGWGEARAEWRRVKQMEQDEGTRGYKARVQQLVYFSERQPLRPNDTGPLASSSMGSLAAQPGNYHYYITLNSAPPSLFPLSIG
ncbi:hypothetical protein E2C01_053438 [Portunus trituberculatus]|uniref:Uncharacterized protein n=1 Tax=Portunus trituberculatus TaxID=210409 RepID=A0A5B7GP70_PORTR|nr:hypothetical protein [Portunus trituberculatus]